MIEHKTIQIRDRATCIPAVAFKFALDSDTTDREIQALKRVGFGGPREWPNYTMVMKLSDMETRYDSFQWPNQRTMGTAHRHIEIHWDEIKSGDVVDVEFILGETPERKDWEF
jgi:hypothetical protein